MAHVGQGASYSYLFWLDKLFQNGTLTFYAGTMPASPETALAAGNTTLVSWTFSSFSTPTFSSGNESATASFVNSSASPVNTGTVSFARAVPPSWAASTAYTVGAGVTNGGNLYQCVVAGTSATTGGPSGTTSSITDGSVTWQYIGPGNALVDYTVGTTGSDIIVGNVTILSSTTVTMSLTHQVPAY